jgi:hypothetical protein
MDIALHFFSLFGCISNQNLQSYKLISWHKSCEALKCRDEAPPQWEGPLSFSSGHLARFFEVCDGAGVLPVAVVCCLSDVPVCCGVWYFVLWWRQWCLVCWDMYVSFGCWHSRVHPFLSKYFWLSSLDNGYVGCASATPELDPVNPNGFNYRLVEQNLIV